MNPKFGVVVFPGSNCDHDAFYAIKKLLKYETVFLWHKESDLQGANVIILPGGFSYGDYLRSGAIARFSSIMKSVIEFANKGGTVIGICIGFQILLEAGLLSGVMLKNEDLKFVCKNVHLNIENGNTRFTSKVQKDVIKIPIAHGEGNYFADDETLKSLEDNNQIVFKYSSDSGLIDKNFNPNGSKLNIAGIINKDGNILGMMPHPERCVDPNLGNTDGKYIFESVIENL